MKTDILYVMNVSNNKKVIGGLFRLSDTNGIPLADSLKELKEKDLIFSAEDYIFDALSALWIDEKIAQTLSEAYRDSGLEKPEYNILTMIKMVILRHWNKKESFQELGKRMIMEYRK